MTDATWLETMLQRRTQLPQLQRYKTETRHETNPRPVEKYPANRVSLSRKNRSDPAKQGGKEVNGGEFKSGCQ